MFLAKIFKIQIALFGDRPCKELPNGSINLKVRFTEPPSPIDFDLTKVSSGDLEVLFKPHPAPAFSPTEPASSPLFAPAFPL
jgi:hypothetical protein